MTLDGQASIQHYDRDGKQRITTATLPSGEATIMLSSSQGEKVWSELSR